MMKWKWNKMNERIRELADEAAKFSAVMALPTGEPGDKLFVEKFAELIVRECAELSANSQYANTKNEYYEGFNEALIYVGNKIKQHFGVEDA